MQKSAPIFSLRNLLYALLIGWMIVDVVIIFNGGYSSEIYTGIYGKEHFTLINLLIYISCVAILYCALHFLTEKLPSVSELVSHPLPAVMSAALCFRVWYYGNFDKFMLYYDTDSYGVDYTGDLLAGKVDIFRTPVYPYLMKFLRLFSTNDVNWYNLIVAFQITLSFFSLILLYLALKKIVRSNKVAAGATLLYGCCPFAIQWDLCILTESITLSSVILFMYVMMSYLSKPTRGGAIATGAVAFYMVMLRPTFIYLFAILGVFWVVRFIVSKLDRKQTVAGFLSLVVALGLTGGYCYMNYTSNNFFGISSVGTTVNNFYIVVSNNWYQNEEYQEISDFIFNEQYVNGETNIHLITLSTAEKFSRAEMADFVRSCLENHSDEYRTYTINKFKSQMSVRLAVQYCNMRDAVAFSPIDLALLNITCPLTFAQCFLIVGAALLLCLYTVIRKKRILWKLLGLCAVAFSHTFVSIYGSMAEYERLSLPAIIPILFICAFVLDIVVSSMSRKKATAVIVDESQEIMVK